jgi:predicted DNA-binding transcriptional regulator YafY
MDQKKLSAPYIFLVLRDYSDADHLMTLQDIAGKILSLYGLDLERKSISENIDLLNDLFEECNLPYEITKTRNQGSYLSSRPFEPSEITFLVDAIFSSKAIPGKEAASLSERIVGTLSKYDRKDYREIYKASQVNRTLNEAIFYNIDLINEAIKKGKQIAFTYLDYDDNGNRIKRKNGKIYTLSPYYTANSYGRYYLIASQSDLQEVVTYRIDNMADLRILNDQDAEPMEKNPGFKDFDIVDFLNTHIYIYHDRAVNAKILLDGYWGIRDAKDWFGDSLKVVKEGDKNVAYLRCSPQSLVYWCIQYGDRAELLEPIELREQAKKLAASIAERYSK